MGHHLDDLGRLERSFPLGAKLRPDSVGGLLDLVAVEYSVQKFIGRKIEVLEESLKRILVNYSSES